MSVTSMMREFTIRTRMVGAVVVVMLALVAVGGVGIAAQWRAGAANAAFVEASE